MTPEIHLTTAQRRAVADLLRAYLPGMEVRAYGSRVKGTSRPSSDLDLVAFAGPQQHRQVAELREAFEESNLPFRVDVLVWDEVPASFRDEIARESVTLTSSGKTPPASARSTP